MYVRTKDHQMWYIDKFCEDVLISDLSKIAKYVCTYYAYKDHLHIC